MLIIESRLGKSIFGRDCQDVDGEMFDRILTVKNAYRRETTEQRI